MKLKCGLSYNTSCGMSFVFPLLGLSMGWLSAAFIYLIELRSYDGNYPKEVLLNYCVIPTFVFIAILVITLLIRPLYSFLGFGKLGKIDEPIAHLPATKSAKAIFTVYSALAMTTIALAGFCQLAFIIIFFVTKF